MTNFYSQDLIDRIRESNDIVDLISEYVPLKKRGKNYMGLCPFHPEKKPSFSVSQDKQIYYCFGCGQGGNVITFLMNHDKLGFTEAVRTLAKKAGITLPRKPIDREKQEIYDKLYFANQIAHQFFQNCLNHKTMGKRARDYLETRGLKQEIIESFGIGYAPAGWEGLLRFAKTKGVDLRILNSAGLVVQSERKEGYYDRFRDRLIFPISNLSGRIIGFGGRVLKEEDEPKYLNSPETLIYQKGKLLYGLNLSKEIIRENNSAVVVEGYMDLISLYQAGMKNVVASSGTAFTSDQARLLSRYAEEVFLLFDSDSAGRKAALRSVDSLFDYGLEVLVMDLPSGEDPDSFVRKYGAKSILEKKKEAKSFIDFKVESIGEKFFKLSLSEQERIISEFSQTAQNIGDPVRRSLFLTKVAQKLEVDERILLNSIKKVKPPSATEKVTQNRTVSGERRFEMEFLRILMEDDKLLNAALAQLAATDFSFPEHQQIFEILTRSQKEGRSISPSALIDRAEDLKVQELVSWIATMDLGPADLEILFKDYVKKLLRAKKNKKVKEIKEAISRALSSKKLDQVEKLTHQLKELLENK
ncbi:MAG: DNA primase [Candidatus Zixiibacteriota bacterium]